MSTTTTTTTTMPEWIQYDEFDDETIAPFWIDDTGAGTELTETSEGDLQLYCNTDCQNGVYQYLSNIPADFDVYCKVTMPDREDIIGADADLGIWMEFGDDNNWMSLSLAFTDSDWVDYKDDCTYATWDLVSPRQYTFYVDAENYDAETCLSHGVLLGPDQSTLWMRIKQVAGEMSFYYALSEPGLDSDWIPDSANAEPFDMGWGATNPYFYFGVWGNLGNHTDKTFTIAYFREWDPNPFVPDEFDVEPLGDLEHWGYSAHKHLDEAPYSFEQVDRDTFQYIQDGKLAHYWKKEITNHYYAIELRQGSDFDPNANPPYGDWTIEGISGPLDVYMKIALPSTFYMTQTGSGGGNFQFVFSDENGYGPGIWIVHGNDSDGWDWYIQGWIYNYVDDYDESDYISIGTAARDIWVRMTWPLDGSYCRFYYALSEPNQDSDWIDITPSTYLFIPNNEDRPFLQMYSQANSYNLSEDLYMTYEYIRQWPWKETLPNWSQSSDSQIDRGTINEGFGGFGFGWS